MAPISKDNRSYHSVKLDDPSFTAPIYANEGDDDEFALIDHRGVPQYGGAPRTAACSVHIDGVASTFFKQRPVSLTTATSGDIVVQALACAACALVFTPQRRPNQTCFRGTQTYAFKSFHAAAVQGAHQFYASPLSRQ
ncbi:DUF736 family protein [Nitrobacter vulgaris]|uniref:DUF736 family protein n=1 Tax=Nitrobacter vulgaris TaxID=29421 RepID=UPI00286CA2F7|nr:DUF736 family protein [Nitrobacter vulgaris]